MRCQTDAKQDKNYSPLNLSKEELIRCHDIISLACYHSQPSELHFQHNLPLYANNCSVMWQKIFRKQKLSS